VGRQYTGRYSLDSDEEQQHDGEEEMDDDDMDDDGVYVYFFLFLSVCLSLPPLVAASLLNTVLLCGSDKPPRNSFMTVLRHLFVWMCLLVCRYEPNGGVVELGGGGSLSDSDVSMSSNDFRTVEVRGGGGGGAAQCFCCWWWWRVDAALPVTAVAATASVQEHHCHHHHHQQQ
jgi:hypothetical protein